MLEFESLTVENGDGFVVDGLGHTQDDRLQVCDGLIVGFVDRLQEDLSSCSVVLLSFLEATTTNYLLLCSTLGEEGKSGGSLFKQELVDHQTDLERKFHEWKGDILERLLRLGLGLGFLGQTLGSRGLRRAKSAMVILCKLGLDSPLDEQQC